MKGSSKAELKGSFQGKPVTRQFYSVLYNKNVQKEIKRASVKPSSMISDDS